MLHNKLKTSQVRKAITEEAKRTAFFMKYLTEMHGCKHRFSHGIMLEAVELAAEQIVEDNHPTLVAYEHQENRQTLVEMLEALQAIKKHCRRLKTSLVELQDIIGQHNIETAAEQLAEQKTND